MFTDNSVRRCILAPFTNMTCLLIVVCRVLWRVWHWSVSEWRAVSQSYSHENLHVRVSGQVHGHQLWDRCVTPGVQCTPVRQVCHARCVVYTCWRPISTREVVFRYQCYQFSDISSLWVRYDLFRCFSVHLWDRCVMFRCVLTHLNITHL